MTDIGDSGRQLHARYAFGGATVALQRAAPLLPDEQVWFHGVMRSRGQGVLPRPVLLRLTAPRLVLLAHFAFRPDVVWQLPRTAVRGAELTDGTLRITWLDGQAELQVTRLSAWTGRAALDEPVRDPRVAEDVLNRWLAGRNDGFVAAPRSHQAD